MAGSSGVFTQWCSIADPASKRRWEPHAFILWPEPAERLSSWTLRGPGLARLLLLIRFL
jgi:hypothetical protein